MMGSLLHTLVFFILALGVLIAFHEFGHFWVARRLGVKVTRFSIGFGKPLWRYQKNPDATEYVVAAIPLGGYVKMVGEGDDDVNPEDLPFAFNRQALWVRIAIVLAGPVFNLLLAVLFFWIVLVVGETGFKPILGKIETNTLAAQSKFNEGDQILSVNGIETPTWSKAMTTLLTEIIEHESVPVVVETHNGLKQTKTLIVPEHVAMDPGVLQERLGFVPWHPKFPAVIDSVLENSPAQAAGLLAGDLIVSTDDIRVENWSQWVTLVQQRPGQTIHVVLERDGVEIDIDIRLKSVDANGKQVGRVGASGRIPQELVDHLTLEYRLDLWPALHESFLKVGEFSILTVKIMGRMLIGKASIENLSGPISIAKYAGQSASMGVVHFLKFLAFISISLGVLNLMPVPMLDGGHLLFFIIEGIKGSPVSDHVQAIGQQVGIVLLLSLMGLAFFLDIERLFQ